MRGARVVLDVHNFARYRAALIGSEAVPAPALADLWARLATRYKDNQRVVFGLMNEPVGISARAWRDAASSAISSIRATGARNLILVPGTSWTGAHSWLRGGDGVSNGSVMAELRDPADNFAFEVHQYFDRDYSGTSDVCRSEDIGVRTLSRFTQWLKDNRFKGFLGEFGASSNQTCMAALENTLKFLNVNDDVWTGWTYWAAGAWWNNYPFSVEPAGGTDKPQMKILMQYGRGAPASQ
jgi:endoglucanase